jgi:hypothetical protein
MIEIVIKYDIDKNTFGIYEPSTNTYMISANLSEGLVGLERFLIDTKLIEKGLLDSTNITYHLDSYSMKAIIESNVALMKRLNSAPSGFMISQQKFGGNNLKQSFDNTKKQKGSYTSSGSGKSFSKTGFKNSYKKFKG